MGVALFGRLLLFSLPLGGLVYLFLGFGLGLFGALLFIAQNLHLLYTLLYRV